MPDSRPPTRHPPGSHRDRAQFVRRGVDRRHRQPHATATPSGGLSAERIAELDALCTTARRAATQFRTLGQDQVDAIVHAMARAGIEHAAHLAMEAVNETRIGLFEDKVVKNYLATEFLHDHLRGRRTVGVIDEDPASRVQTVAEPIGVLLAVLPLTNPTATVLYKAILAAKTRNAVIFRPSSRAERCTAETLRVIIEAGEREGLPVGALQHLAAPTVPDTAWLFRHREVDLIWTTGGQRIVQAANEAGKPTIGVGPGNAPVYLERTCDIPMAVCDILLSKTFDASVICPAEQTAVVDDPIYEAVLAEFTRMGGRVLSRDESIRVTGVCFDEAGEPRPESIGRGAIELARRAGVDVEDHVRLLLAPLDAFDRSDLLLHEKLFPVLAVLRAGSLDEALDLCDGVLQIAGMGHTSAVYSRDDEVVARFSERMRTGRILVNAPTAVGALGGIYNELPPTFSLGCGTWGGSTTTANIGVEQLLNLKRVSARKTPPMAFRMPTEVQYGEHAIEQLRELGAARVAIVASPGNVQRGAVDQVRGYLVGAQVSVFAEVGPEPDEQLVARGVAFLDRVQPDAIIALGGGSVIDAAKVMRLLHEHPECSWRELAMPFLDVRRRLARFPTPSGRLRLVAVPTTSGTGSEVSPVAVITDSQRGAKATLVDPCLSPQLALVDPQFTRTLPPTLVADGGVDALTHAIEASVSVFSSPYTDSLCLQAITMLRDALPAACASSDDGATHDARGVVHNASTIAGIAFSNAFVGVCHALAHAVGATFGIPHGRANALFLPHVIRYNASLPTKLTPAPGYTSYVAPERYGRIATALGLEPTADALAAEVERLLDEVGMPRSLVDAGVDQEQFQEAFPRLLTLAFADMSSRTNPRMPLIEELQDLLLGAWDGR